MVAGLIQIQQTTDKLTVPISDTADCYRKAERADGTTALRRCMIFDLASFGIDNAMRKIAPGVGGLPYYDAQTVGARLGHYGPLAKFKDANEALAFLNPRSSAVHAEIVRLKQAQPAQNPADKSAPSQTPAP